MTTGSPHSGLAPATEKIWGTKANCFFGLIFFFYQGKYNLFHSLKPISLSHTEIHTDTYTTKQKLINGCEESITGLSRQSKPSSSQEAEEDAAKAAWATTGKLGQTVSTVCRGGATDTSGH